MRKIAELEPVGAFIRRIRVSKGLTQTAVAKAAGIGSAFLCDVEQGKRGFGPQTLLQLAKALGIHSDDLAKRLGEKLIGELEARIAKIRKGA